MKKNQQETAHSVRRSLLAFLFVAAVLAVAALAPIVNKSRAQGVTTSTAAANRTSRSDDAKRSGDPKLVYPESKKVDQVDDYFGTKVPDPYRWLEDETSAETKAWVEDQNKVTFAYLDKITYREKLNARLTELYNY